MPWAGMAQCKIRDVEGVYTLAKLQGGEQSALVSRILLVDDDRDMADSLADMLRSEGHDVHTASSGEEGLRTLRASPLPDIVLLDVDLPILSGPGMAHKMLLHDAGEEHVPVVLVSARHDLREIAGRMGTPYFFEKTSDIDKLLQVIDRALRERVAPASA